MVVSFWLASAFATHSLLLFYAKKINKWVFCAKFFKKGTSWTDAEVLLSWTKSKVMKSRIFYTAKNVNISSSCNEPVKIRLVAIVIFRLVTTCWNNLQQACWYQVWTINSQQVCTLTTCSRLVIIKLSQAMRTHPDIGLLWQVVTTCQQTCCNLRVFGCLSAQLSTILLLYVA